MSEINFEYYKAFYYAAKLKSITAAASYLYLSQPSISRSIKNLEEALECKLFERSKNGVTLTAAGNLLYKHISVACRHILSAEEEIRLMNDSGQTVIRLGGSEVALESFLIERIVEFHRRYPKTHIQINSMSTPAALEALRSNLIDIAVVTSPLPDKRNLDIMNIWEIQDIIIAGNQYSDLKDRVLSFSELTAYPLISLNQSTSARHYIDTIFSQYNIHLKPDIELTSVNLILPMVCNNLGLGFTQHSFAEKYIESGDVFIVHTKENIPIRNICAVTSSQFPVPAAVNRFISIITEIL